MILAPVPKQFVDQCGVPYRDGSVEVFLNGDTRRAVLYTDSEGTTEAENPSILDSHGSWKAFVDPDVSLDYVVKDEFGNVIFEYYGVKAGTFDGVPHDSTLVGAGTRTRPLGINTSIISGLQEQIDSHVQNYNNPHQVTAHQVGAYTQQETEDRINDAVAAEKAQREAADNALQSQIDSIQHNVLDVGFDNDELVFTKGKAVV